MLKPCLGFFAGNKKVPSRLGMKFLSLSKRVSDLDEIDRKYKVLRQQNRKRNLIGRNVICGFWAGLGFVFAVDIRGLGPGPCDQLI